MSLYSSCPELDDEEYYVPPDYFPEEDPLLVNHMLTYDEEEQRQACEKCDQWSCDGTCCEECGERDCEGGCEERIAAELKKRREDKEERIKERERERKKEEKMKHQKKVVAPKETEKERSNRYRSQCTTTLKRNLKAAEIQIANLEETVKRLKETVTTLEEKVKIPETGHVLEASEPKSTGVDGILEGKTEKIEEPKVAEPVEANPPLTRQAKPKRTVIPGFEWHDRGTGGHSRYQCNQCGAVMDNRSCPKHQCPDPIKPL